MYVVVYNLQCNRMDWLREEDSLPEQLAERPLELLDAEDLDEGSRLLGAVHSIVWCSYW